MNDGARQTVRRGLTRNGKTRAGGARVRRGRRLIAAGSAERGTSSAVAGPPEDVKPRSSLGRSLGSNPRLGSGQPGDNTASGASGLVQLSGSLCFSSDRLALSGSVRVVVGGATQPPTDRGHHRARLGPFPEPLLFQPRLSLVMQASRQSSWLRAIAVPISTLIQTTPQAFCDKQVRASGKIVPSGEAVPRPAIVTKSLVKR